MTYLFDDKIRYDDSPNIDAFGGLRSTSARVLGEYRFQYDNETQSVMNDHLEGTGVLTSDTSNCQFLATVTTASGDRVVYQTKQYHPYISGTSNKAIMTFRMGTHKANVIQAVGLFDDRNGIYFRMNGLTPEMVIRKKGVDNEVVPRTSWNLDRLDGSMNEYNPSGITADFTKCHIFTCDYQWLGVGRVRVGFVIDGAIHYVHQFRHANNTTEPYIMQPSLPLRWEIKNSGTAASASTLQVICGAVYCEGSDVEVGFTHSISTDGNTTTISNTTDGQCLLAIKLKDTITGKPNQMFARIKEWAILATNDVNYRIVIAPNASSIFNGTPAWANVPGYSVCQYVKNPSLQTGWAANVNYVAIADGFAAGATGAGSGANQLTGSFTLSDSIYQNYFSNNSQILAVICTKIANNSDCKATLRWIEIK
jgi:hypothetical protein